MASSSPLPLSLDVPPPFFDSESGEEPAAWGAWLPGEPYSALDPRAGLVDCAIRVLARAGVASAPPLKTSLLADLGQLSVADGDDAVDGGSRPLLGSAGALPAPLAAAAESDADTLLAAFGIAACQLGLLDLPAPGRPPARAWEI